MKNEKDIKTTETDEELPAPKLTFKSSLIIICSLLFLLIAFFCSEKLISSKAPEAMTLLTEPEHSVTELQMPININTASYDELVQIPGIGNKLANAIIHYRDENGPFDSIEAITDVYGIGEGIYNKIKDYITVE